jgi:hypothetical protein
MPSLVARRNCNATISPSPLQGVAPNAAQLVPGSSSHWDRTLAAPYRGHVSSASPALTRSEPLSQALGRSRRRECTYKSLVARTSNGRHGVPARQTSHRTSRMGLRAFIHLRRGGRRYTAARGNAPTHVRY